MKFLTLNTHSWMEKEAEEKFQILLEDILEKDYDLICFQEINQEITSPVVEVNDLYQALPAAEPIHQDHYVRLLVEKLSEQGKDYYWTWAYNHIGYDRYHEGVAILSKTPIEAREILVSDVDDPTDYHTRRVALAETVVDGKDLAVASVHLSWWDKGFQEEWARFEAVLKELNKPLLLAGDFNNPAGQEGYQAILASPLGLQDAFEVAQEMSFLAKAVVQSLDTLPDILERDCGLTPSQLTRVIQVIDDVKSQMSSHIQAGDDKSEER